MRALALALVLLPGLCLAQENPVTNGGFEALDAAGNPVDWQTMGSCKVTTDAHWGKYAMLLERDPQTEGEVGMNRAWEAYGGKQGAMLSQLKGGIRFWYKAEVASGPKSLLVYVIPMSADPLENTDQQRAEFDVPESQVGDGQWHEGLLKYDFTGSQKVKWVHISPRISGARARLLLDDFSWVDHVGPLPAITKTELTEVKGREGEECLVQAQVQNAGDETLEIGMGALKLPEGLTAEGGPVRTLQALKPDDYGHFTWRVRGLRADKGAMQVTFSAAARSASALLAYAPRLEVTGLFTPEFILSPDRPATVSLRLRNTGHALVRQVRAELQPGLPLSTARQSRRQTLEAIRPQTEAEITWKVSAEAQSPQVRLRAVADAANAEGGRATTTVVVGPPTPPVAEPPDADVTVRITPALAYLGNGHVRLLLPKADFGFGLGILQRKVGRAWETVGKLPRLSRLVLFQSSTRSPEYPVYATEARQIPSPPGAPRGPSPEDLELRATVVDDLGVTWNVSERIGLLGSDSFALRITASPNKDAEVLDFEGPMLYVGEGAAAGTRRLDAIFPGLEWLVEGEESSSALDIAPDHPDRVRYVPSPHSVTIPLMAARLQPPAGEATTVALMWDHLRPYYGQLNRPSAAFASPDRFEGHDSTLMGLFAPSMPEYIAPNQRVAHQPLHVAAGSSVELSARICALPAPAGDTSLAAVNAWFQGHPAPDPEPLPHGATWQDEITFSMAGYLDSLWIPKLGKWHPSLGGPGMWDVPSVPPNYLYDLRMCLDLCPDGPVRRRVQERYDLVTKAGGGGAWSDDDGFQYAGPADNVLSRADTIAGDMASQGADGSWRFRARIETSGVFKGLDYADLGPDNAAEVGTCARTAWEVLRFSHMTGDKLSREAGLRALAFMDRFEVPRAAQVWEVPVHTPDILASADACEAYLEGYFITGRKPYLDKAVYWGRTGLPFVYTWDVAGYEFLKYASIPVFGASWLEGSWFGRPVQWNGLRYAFAVLKLAPLDPSLDWAKIARGITISAMYQQSADDQDKALWPDSIGSFKKDKAGWIFPPVMILKNVYALMGAPSAPVTVTVPATPGGGAADGSAPAFRVSATAGIKDAAYDVGRLSFKLLYPPSLSGYALICGAGKPTAVRVNGAAAAEMPPGKLPAAGDPPCWRYLPDASAVELRLKDGGTQAVELEGVKYSETSFTAAPVSKIAFTFAESTGGWRAINHMEPLTVQDGALVTLTTGGDPYMRRANLRVPAAGVTQITVRMSLEPGMNTAGRFYWTTSESPSEAEDKVAQFTAIADGQPHDYLLPVGKDPMWAGTITSIRLNPCSGLPPGQVRVVAITGN